MKPNHLTKLVSFLFSALLLVGFSAKEDELVDKIIEKIRVFNNTYPREKAYLHLDRETYSVGDTLWFKAYLAEGFLHHADTVSKLLYVDFIENATGKVKYVKYVSLKEGIGRGDLILRDSLEGGTYTVRAYTNWMRNFKEDYFFHREVTLFRSDRENIRTSQNSASMSLQFFPEGGAVVQGVNNRIAFKAVGTDGLGVEVDGFILNQSTGDTVAGFHSTHLGMGYFSLHPEPGVSYTAKARLNAQRDYVDCALPKFEASGFGMIVDNVSNKTDVKVFIYNRDIPVGTDLMILVHTRGIVGLAAKIKTRQTGAFFSFPRKELQEGISVVTLFNANGHPVAERIIFVDHKNRLNIDVKPNKPYFTKRERSVLEVSVTDTAGKPVETSLSLAVTDANQDVFRPNGMNVISSLLLSSDLEGYVEDPGYYFDPANDDSPVKLDILMMTQGWRRFKWEEILKDSLTKPQWYVEGGFSIEGQVTRLNSKLPGKVNLTIMMTGRDSTQGFGTTQTSEQGLFNIFNLDIRDTTKVFIQATNQKGNRNLKIKVTPLTTPVATVISVPYNPVVFDADQLEEFLRRAKEYQNFIKQARARGERVLKEVLVTAKRRKEEDSRKIYGNPDATFKVSDMIIGGAQTVLDLIQGRVAGVVVSGSGMNATVSIRGSGEAAFLLDGMPVDIETALAVSVQDIETVDVLKGASAAIFGGRGAGGVISILTKRGNEHYDYSKEPAPGVLVYNLPGYSKEREFYAPAYNRMTPDDALRPDFRATVFWSANVRTGKDGKARVAYFNSDAAGKINVKVEGLTSTGTPGSVRTQYEIR